MTELDCHPENLTCIIYPIHEALQHPKLGRQLFMYHADDCRINDKVVACTELPSANPGCAPSPLFETGHARSVKKGLPLEAAVNTVSPNQSNIVSICCYNSPFLNNLIVKEIVKTILKVCFVRV